jgi:low affinity Fe/Cu permease
MRATKSKSPFTRFAKSVSKITGRPIAFGTAVLIIVVWLATGPIFHYNDSWQLLINTGTTIVTFLMVFLIQATQNRDAEAVQVKLDELLRVTAGAHNALLDLEELEELQLDRIRATYTQLAQKAREALARGGDDTDVGQL